MEKTDKTITKGTTALEVVKNILDEKSIDYDVIISSFGDYINAIAGTAAGSLGGWDVGCMK